MNQRAPWAATAVLLLAAALRLFRLDQQSMWFDEAARLLIGRLPISAILSNEGRDAMPPLYHTTMHFWMQIANGDFALRLPSAFASLLLVAICYRLAADLFGRRTGVVAALLSAVLPYGVFDAQQANVYSLVTFFTALQILFFWRAIQHDTPCDWLGFTLSGIASIYSHYFTTLITLTLHLYLLLQGRKHQRSWFKLLLADGLIALSFLPHLPIFIREASVVSTGLWLTPPHPLAPLLTFYTYIASYSLPGSIVPIALFIVLAFLAIAIFELVYDSRRRQTVSQLLFIALLTFFPIAAAWLISQVAPIYLDRRLIMIMPAYTILLARAIAQSRLKSPLPYLAMIVFAIMLFSLGNYYFDPTYHKPDYRAVAAHIAERDQPGDAILHTSNGSYIPFLLYDVSSADYLLAGDPAPHYPPLLHEVTGGQTITPDDLAGYQRLWLVVALEHSIEWQQQQAAYFAAQYPELDHYEISGIQLILYDLQPNTQP